MNQPDPRRWRLLGLLAVAQFMLILDVTVVAIALPTLPRPTIVTVRPASMNACDPGSQSATRRPSLTA